MKAKRKKKTASNKLKDLLETFHKKKAANLILTVGSPPIMKTGQDFEAIANKPLMPDDIKELVYELLDNVPKWKEKVEKGEDLDFSFGIQGWSRYRGNIFRQRGALNAVFTQIPFKIPTWAEIKAPKNVLSYTNSTNGLIFVTGPPGSGKTTIMASLVQHITKTRYSHIISLEEPIEYLFRHDKGIVIQRHIGSDVKSWKEGLRSIFRQSPDIAVLGEVRNPENFQAALDIASTCCLCIVLLHAPNTIRALEQIIENHPSEHRDYARSILADCFLFGLSSRLLPKKKGKGRLAAYEILKNNANIEKIIKKGTYAQLKQYLKPSLNSSLRKLKREGKIV